MGSVLFVCTGNICRSPTAEAVFRHYSQSQEGVAGFACESAGTHGYHIGEPPDSRAVKIAAEYGIDMSDMLARDVVDSDFKRFDYIIAMDRGHLKWLESRAKNSKALIRLLLDDVSQYGTLDVPDPYYGGLDDFRKTFGLIQDGVQNFLKNIE
ncbi:MAG: low molecular weight phosphotyrosine protein phosphatase [Alphaproteobacteria bacterium]|nr:low molecular weight phosphotyrosine protein phosphatase [Alphaproteobacteria bacterium]